MQIDYGVSIVVSWPLTLGFLTIFAEYLPAIVLDGWGIFACIFECGVKIGFLMSPKCEQKLMYVIVCVLCIFFHICSSSSFINF